MNRPNRLPVLAGLLIAVIALTFAALTPHRAHAGHSRPLQPSSISAWVDVTKAAHPDNATYSAALNWTTGKHKAAGAAGSTEFAPPSKYQYNSNVIVITHSGTTGNLVTTITGDTPPTDGWQNVNHTANKYNYSATISLANASTNYILWVRSCNSDASVCSSPLATIVDTPPQRPGPLNFSMRGLTRDQIRGEASVTPSTLPTLPMRN